MTNLRLLSFNTISGQANVILPYSSTLIPALLSMLVVDDIIVTGNNPTFIKSLVTKLNSEFSLKDLGNLDYFLGIDVRLCKRPVD